MTAAPPGATRSLGSSLLDQVLAETLDPSYAQAAAARHARSAAGVPEAPRRDWSPAVAVLLLVVGVLATVTYRESSRGAEGRQQVRQALVQDVGARSRTGDELAAQLDVLRRQVSAARDGALAASSEGQVALRQLARAEQGAAVVPVHGPGLQVTLADAPADTGSDPVGGAPQTDLVGLVQDRDIQLAVNALWASGAEAISIDGQRLGPTTAIRLAGQAVLVDFRPVTSPYVISAVGDPQRMQDAFVRSAGATELLSISSLYGVVFDLARAEDLELPAGGAAELRSARPLDPAGAPPVRSGAPGTAPPVPTTPTTSGD